MVLGTTIGVTPDADAATGGEPAGLLGWSEAIWVASGSTRGAEAGSAVIGFSPQRGASLALLRANHLSPRVTAGRQAWLASPVHFHVRTPLRQAYPRPIKRMPTNNS